MCFHYRLVKGHSDEKPLNVQLGQEVTHIGMNKSRIQVKTASGDIYVGDSVIVTVPLGVLKADTINFNPPLPNYKTNAVRKLGKCLGLEHLYDHDDGPVVSVPSKAGTHHSSETTPFLGDF